MSISGRIDLKTKKIIEKAKKKNEDLSRIGSAHSETDDRIMIKPIDGEDVQCLSIRENDLKKFTAEKPKPGEKNDPVLVKKVNPKAYPTTEVKVAKLVPNKPTKPIDLSDNLGIRFDKIGNCVPYSILGTVEDFLCEAVANGKSIELPYDTLDSDRPIADSYLADSNLTQKPANFDFNSDGGQKALTNWQRRMNERKSVQDLVSKKSNRNANELVMNQYDSINKKIQLNTVIDRALPLVEHGKGYRFGSEFWNQPFRIGDENKGIFTTLNKSERGIIPPLEQIDKPEMTYRETHFDSKQPNLNTYPWSKSKYLEQRLKKLEPIIKEIMPHQVEFDELQVSGSNPLNKRKQTKELEAVQEKIPNELEEFINYTWVNPEIEKKSPLLQQDNNGFLNQEDDVLASYEDVVDEPVFGPCLIFGGQTAIWTGSDDQNEGIVALESRLNFETKAGKRVLATFEVFNAGTCAVYYDWKKLKEINPFQIVNSKEQRFYFDTRSNVILPGDALKLHIVFKSKKGGIFTEKWEFITRPCLLSGASLVLTLRGVALQEDKFKKRRISLEKNLFLREAEIIAKDVIDLILAGVQTPRRSPSPVDFKLIEDQVFTEKNNLLPYDQETVNELKDLYSNLMSDESEHGKEEWNLSVHLLKQRIQLLDEENPEKCQEKMATLNNYLEKMSIKSYVPTQPKAYSICYNILCTAFDDIFNEISNFKQHENIQLPASADSYPAVDQIDKKFQEWKKELEVLKQIEAERKNRLEKEKGGKGVDKAKKVEKKDDKKKEKGKPLQTPSGAKSRNSRDSAALSRSESRTQERTLIEEKEIEPVVLTEAQIKRKELFEAKSYYIIYQLLVKTFDKIEDAFEMTIERPTIDSKNMLIYNPIVPLNCDFID